MSITEEQFEALLRWLAPDREAGARKYEAIRSALIKLFISRGFSDAEDLADLTINRVAGRISEIEAGYVGDPTHYFHGVARYVAREALRRKEVATDKVPETLNPPARTSDRYDCLLKCLEAITEEQRELILGYYLYDGREKIEHRRRIAVELSLSEGALRLRTFHIRAALEKCVSRCTRRLAENKYRLEEHYLRGGPTGIFR